MNGSIFDRIVTNENSFTELFVTLCRYRLFRAEFAAFLRENELCALPAAWDQFAFESNEIDTQSQTDDERPDIVIRTRDHLLAVEVKTSTTTELTCNQKRGYPGILNSKSETAKRRALVFLVPKGYGHLNELDSSAIDFHVAYWEDLIARLESKGLGELNSHVFDFIMLSQTLFGTGAPTISVADLPLLYDSNTATFYERVVNMVEAVNQSLDSAHVKVGKPSRNEYEYGFYIFSDDKRIGYFGSAAYHWKEFGQALCTGVRRELVAEAMNEFPTLKRGHMEGGLQYLGIPGEIWHDTPEPPHRLSRLLAVVSGEPQLSERLRYNLPVGEPTETSAQAERAIASLAPALWSLVDTVRLRMQHSIHPGQEPRESPQVGRANADRYWRWFAAQSGDKKRTILFGWVYGGWWSKYGSPLFLGARDPDHVARLSSGDEVGDPGHEEGWHYRAVPRSILTIDEENSDIAEACVSLIRKSLEVRAR